MLVLVNLDVKCTPEYEHKVTFPDIKIGIKHSSQGSYIIPNVEIRLVKYLVKVFIDREYYINFIPFVD